LKKYLAILVFLYYFKNKKLLQRNKESIGEDLKINAAEII
jgi:hypothetical protein